MKDAASELVSEMTRNLNDWSKKLAALKKEGLIKDYEEPTITHNLKSGEHFITIRYIPRYAPGRIKEIFSTET